MRLFFGVVLLSALPSGAGAQVYVGPARAIDGDTLAMGEQHVRLHGMDAVEAGQTCLRAGSSWPCGLEAKAFLARLVKGQSVTCQQVDSDRYGRIVARCAVDRRDLGAAMVEAGYAVALPQYSEAYVEAEARTRRHPIGIWSGSFETPAAYRAAHPRPNRPRVPGPTPRSVSPRSGSLGVVFANCAQARAAGAAPILLGQPGYRTEMDGDNDGIACEPYRGR